MRSSARLSRSGRTATLSLDRPPLNILDLEMLDQLGHHLKTLGRDPDLHILVIESTSERAFSAGVAIEDHSPDKIESMLATFHEVLRGIRDLPALSLAVVQGHCLGGGMELATSCDLLVAAEDANFGLPEVELGCFPPAAAALFPQRLGPGRTLELLLTGRRLDGLEALELGLATWVAPQSKLEEKKERILSDLTGRSASVARLIKRAVRAGETSSFRQALAATENIYLSELAQTADMEEGLLAFQERRPPRWTHR